MAPVLLCFAFAMITLEEIDDKVSRYFSITPLENQDIFFKAWNTCNSVNGCYIYCDVNLFIGKTVRHHGFRLVRFRAVQAIMVALMIITLSANKLEEWQLQNWLHLHY